MIEQKHCSGQNKKKIKTQTITAYNFHEEMHLFTHLNPYSITSVLFQVMFKNFQYMHL